MTIDDAFLSGTFGPVRERLFSAWTTACRNEERADLGEVRLDRVEGRELLIALHLQSYLALLEDAGRTGDDLAGARAVVAAGRRCLEHGQYAQATNGTLELLVRIDLAAEERRRIDGEPSPADVAWAAKVMMLLAYEYFGPVVGRAIVDEPRWWVPTEQPIADLHRALRERVKTAVGRLVDQRWGKTQKSERVEETRRLSLLEDAALRPARDRERGDEILDRFDDPEARKARFAAAAARIARNPRALTVSFHGRPIALPFTIQTEPSLDARGRYPAFELRGQDVPRTFAYEIGDVRRDREFQRVPDAAKDQELALLARALHAHGAAFVNGTKLASIERISGTPDRPSFAFHGVRYFDYFAANVITDPPYAGEERPDAVWSAPRGAFPGASALVITEDDYAVLAVREDRVAADRKTINTSVSGGIELDDIDPPAGAVSAPFELALLREGQSEISQVFADAARRSSTLTFLGFLRNLHRNFLAELLWLVELHDLDSDEWIARWKEERVRLAEAYELVDELSRRPHRRRRNGRADASAIWLPALLFIKRARLEHYSDRVLDPARLSFDWLNEAMSRGELKTTLDRDPMFSGNTRTAAIEALQTRQPAAPLLATLGAYTRMRQRINARRGA